MAVTVVEDTTGTTTTDGTEQTLFTKEDGGVFFFRCDLVNMVADATPDILELREYVSVPASATLHLVEGSPVTYQAGLFAASGFIVELPQRAIVANSSYRVTIKRVAGSNFDLPWVLYEVG